MIFTQAVNSFLVELKANPRLRWGVWGIVGVLWFYGVLELRDEVQRQSDTYHSISKKISRTQETALRTEWPNRLVETQSLQLDLESRLWRESTIGLAQASFHDWLNLSAQQANLTKVQLTVAAQDGESFDGKDKSGNENTSSLWKVSAKLSFDFSPQSFYPFMARIAAHDKKVAIESLVIRGTPSPKAELILAAYFLKPASGTEAAPQMNRGQ